jgi:hypothetical protein
MYRSIDLASYFLAVYLRHSLSIIVYIGIVKLTVVGLREEYEVYGSVYVCMYVRT